MVNGHRAGNLLNIYMIHIMSIYVQIYIKHSVVKRYEKAIFDFIKIEV